MTRKRVNRNVAMIATYYGPPQRTLKETGDLFGVSRERVRQILARDGYHERHGKRKPVSLIERRCAVCGNTFTVWPSEQQVTCSREHGFIYRDAWRMHRTRQAYQLRKDGWKWKHIAAELGYTSGVSATSAVRVHAIANGLPWPVHRPWFRGLQTHQR